MHIMIVNVSYSQVARKVGLVQDQDSHVSDSSGKKDLTSGVVIRKHDTSDTNRLPPPKPKRSGNYKKSLVGKQLYFFVMCAYTY